MSSSSSRRGEGKTKGTDAVAAAKRSGSNAETADDSSRKPCQCCQAVVGNGDGDVSPPLMQMQSCGCAICKDCFNRWLSESASAMAGNGNNADSGKASNSGQEDNVIWKCPACSFLMAKTSVSQDDEDSSKASASDGKRKSAAASTSPPNKRRRLPLSTKGKKVSRNKADSDSESDDSVKATPKKRRGRVTRSSTGSSSGRDKKKNGPLKKRSESSSPVQRKSHLTISQRIDQLLTFKDKHGHVDVRLCAIDNPEFTREEKSLAEWVRRIRKQDESTGSRRRSTSLSAEDRQRLTEIGFIWDLQAHYGHEVREEGGDEDNDNEEQTAKRSLAKKSNSNADKNFKRPVQYITKSFEQRCIDYKNYLQRYNVLDVPRRLPKDADDEFKGLNNWAMHVRNGIKNLTREKRKQLTDVGFNFETKQNRLNRQWRESFEKLKQYKAEHGTTQLPWNYQQDKALSEWVHTQRKLKNRGTLIAERQRLLDDIGFHWGVALGPKKDPTRYQRGVKIDQPEAQSNSAPSVEPPVTEQANGVQQNEPQAERATVTAIV